MFRVPDEPAEGCGQGLLAVTPSNPGGAPRGQYAVRVVDRYIAPADPTTLASELRPLVPRP